MDSPRGPFTELWVCFDAPLEQPPADALVLSFVNPGREEALEQRSGGRIVSGRALVDEIRPRARAEYVQLIARLGSSPCWHGRTLRQVLRGPDTFSRWWFLDVTEKDCLWDEDPTYLTILHLTAVRTLMGRHRIERVRLFGGAAALAVALGLRAAGGLLVDLGRAIARGVYGRVRLAFEYWQTLRIVRRLPPAAEEQPDVLLQAYWDWTVRPDGQGGLSDRYFTTLPAQLASRGLRTGWLASSEPLAELWQRGRQRHEVLASAGEHPEVTLLERHLTAGDVLRTVADLRDQVRVTRVVGTSAFRRLCVAAGFDLYPAVRWQILRGVWGATFCRLQLVAAASARACRRLRPKLVLGAFELFARSRAFYAGVRAASPQSQLWAAQHAVYSRDKTFGIIDPTELRGTPDGCPMPAPDGVFAMGDLSRRIWEADGFAADHIVATGGLRYQGVGIAARAPRAPADHVSVLLAGGMNDAAHIDLCEAAVAAAAGLPVRLFFRDHPIYGFANRPIFDRFRGAITVTSGTLDDDFRAADLLLFSQTGIAEEALLRGIPTWQWLWAGCNTSAFLDVPVIPAFTSVATLRRELQGFRSDPARYQPSAETQRRVLQECFGADPAAASIRLAGAVAGLVAGHARSAVGA